MTASTGAKEVQKTLGLDPYRLLTLAGEPVRLAASGLRAKTYRVNEYVFPDADDRPDRLVQNEGYAEDPVLPWLLVGVNLGLIY